ncbi:hypothetical protein AQJ91_36015 [Streptomyces dysideae]|uniref:Major facilitator superfamily (MFS) profile domain-containing protein n=2 Tax=Streptomyces dysideae TaxID=909626 RepID=A0A101UTD3_9ACTN|nr:hypothetical protein AQJ91_36015 [Streptomyces dysideae]
MCVCYFFSYLDRTSVSVAALTMNDALRISATAFGLGAGLFFLGYFIFEVPSNLIMFRVGARVWMARIMVTWGLVAVLQAFVWNEMSFYAIRILLGAAEAGFFPGMILYLTFWFPARQRARVVGLFFCAVPLSTALGAPLGGLLLKVNGLGLEGWQWLFILEGIPTVLLGVFLFSYLTDRPDKAEWLPRPEKEWLTATLRAEATEIEAHHPQSELASLKDPRVLGLAAVYFTLVFGLYGLSFWLPTIIKSSLGIEDNLTVTLLTAAPYAVGAIAIIAAGIMVDRLNQPARITAFFLAAGGLALTVTAFATNPWVGYAGLFICAVAVISTFAGFWRLPTAFLTGAAAAAGIAAVNSLGNIAGFVGPYWVGWLTDRTGHPKWGLVSIGALMILGTVLALRMSSVMRTGTQVKTGEGTAAVTQ